MSTTLQSAPPIKRVSSKEVTNPEPEPSAVVKLSFNLARHQVDTLKKIAEKRGVTMTEVLRHAIALEDFIQDEVAQRSRVFVETPSGDRKELVLIGP